MPDGRKKQGEFRIMSGVTLSHSGPQHQKVVTADRYTGACHSETRIRVFLGGMNRGLYLPIP